jgi:hypothetical protein
MRKYGIILSSLILIISLYSSVYSMPYGIINGLVKWESGQGTIAGATISAYNADGEFVKSTISDPGGVYNLELVAGEYYISAEKENLVKEYFPESYLLKNANRVTVFVGQMISINFNLDLGGWISGTISLNGETINSALVTALKIDQPNEGWSKSVALDGPFPSAYAISGLCPGVYKIVARGRGKTTEYYPGVFEIYDAEALEVLRDHGISDIAFELDQVGWGTLRGQVSDLSTGHGIGDIPIYAYQWKNYWEDPNLVIVRTTCDGNYNLYLPSGVYNIFALVSNPENGSGTIPVYYNNCYNAGAAEAIYVGPSQEITAVDFDVDFSIRHDLTISGIVAGSQSGQGLADITVSAIDCESGKIVGIAQSTDDGEFRINQLSTGNYLLMYTGTSIIPYFYPQVNRWRDGEIIHLMGHSGNVRTEAITQDYGNNGLSIAGNVNSDAGPISGARVYAYNGIQDEPVAYAFTDNFGEYIINRGLAPGDYTVMCDYLGYNYEIFPSTIHLDLVVNPEISDINFHLTTTLSPILTSISPTTISLDGNYPNPFNSNTVIVVYSNFDHSIDSRLQVYNILGQSVGEKSVVINPGVNNILWDSRDFHDNTSSGVYFYRVDGFYAPRRMLYLK